ncbi:hypothetical protein Tco_0903833 [Tanacetum coccineum]
MQELLLQFSKDLPTLGNTSNQLKESIDETHPSDSITPDLPITDSLVMEDEHLDTISETDSDEEIESSIFSNPLFDSNADYTSSDDESSSEEDVPVENFKFYSNPLLEFDEEIFSNTVITFPKIDFLLEQFTGELALINPIPAGIVETNFDPKEDIRLIKKLLYDNSSPRPPEELNFEISDAIIKSFSSSPIPVKDSDSPMEEIDIFLDADDSIPPGIDSDGYDSEEDNLFLDDPLSTVLETLLPFSFEIEDKVFSPGILVIKEEKSPHLLSHRGFKAFKIIHNFLNEIPMMIYEGDMPILDFPYLHFYPP